MACPLRAQKNRYTIVDLPEILMTLSGCRVWVTYLNPIFWTVYGLIESQVANLDALVTLTEQQQVPANEAVRVLFGYK